MLAKFTGFTLLGLSGETVEVEVDTNNGMPAFDIVGLPDVAVKESKERVRSAIKNSGKKFPNHKITVNLAPADLKKEGVGLDLPIALGIIKASGQLGDGDFADTVMIGELSLDGTLRHVTGVLPMLISAMVVIPIAVYFSASVPDEVFKIILGAVLILLSIFFMFFSTKIHFKPSIFKGSIFGALGGKLNGLFSTGGPPVVLYLTHATDTNDSYFAGTQFYFCVTNIYATVMRAINGLLTVEILIYALIGMLGCLLGDFIGRRVFDKLNAKRLKMIIYIGMIISGVLMIVNI